MKTYLWTKQQPFSLQKCLVCLSVANKSLSVDKIPLFEVSSDAVLSLLAAYYTFNINYPHTVAMVFILLEHIFLGIKLGKRPPFLDRYIYSASYNIRMWNMSTNFRFL